MQRVDLIVCQWCQDAVPFSATVLNTCSTSLVSPYWGKKKASLSCRSMGMPDILWHSLRWGPHQAPFSLWLGEGTKGNMSCWKDPSRWVDSIFLAWYHCSSGHSEVQEEQKTESPCSPQPKQEASGKAGCLVSDTGGKENTMNRWYSDYFLVRGALSVHCQCKCCQNNLFSPKRIV